MYSIRLLILCFSISAICQAIPLPIRDPDHTTKEETPEESFKRSDGNRDQRLTFNEFLHTDMAYEQLKREEFDGLDANHDGYVTKGEYETHFQKEKEEHDDLKAEYFGQIFEEFDENFDLKLSQKELEKVIKKRFLLNPPADFAQVFKKFDENNDGGLDISEYLKMDKDIDFHGFEPIAVQPAVDTKEITSGTELPEETSGKYKSPILSVKTEKMPMMKQMFFEKN